MCMCVIVDEDVDVYVSAYAVVAVGAHVGGWWCVC